MASRTIYELYQIVAENMDNTATKFVQDGPESLYQSILISTRKKQM